MEMVQELKNESGRVNFDSFIKGLIKLKPGRGSQDVVSFVIFCLFVVFWVIFNFVLCFVD